MDSSHASARIPPALSALIERARRRGSSCLRLRHFGGRALVHHGPDRHDRRLLGAEDGRRCLQALREAASRSPAARWCVGRLAWSGGPLVVEWRRCVQGERALVRFGAPRAAAGEPAVRRALQRRLLEALARDAPALLGGRAGPEQACALALAIDASDLRSLVEAACDLGIRAACEDRREGLALAREAGRGLAALMRSGQAEPAALLARETTLLPRPGSPVVASCRRLMWGPLLALGLEPPARPPVRPLV